MWCRDTSLSCGPRRAHMRRGPPEPLIPFPGPPTLALAGTLIVPWADLGPRAEMLGGGKPRHLDPDFRAEILRRPLTDARDGVQEGDRLGVRATQSLKVGFTCGNTLCQKIDVREDMGEQPGMMRTQTSLESGLQSRLLLPEAAFGQVC